MTTAADVFHDQQMVFELEGKEFGFEAQYLWEVSLDPILSGVPRGHGALAGVTQLHGRILPVLDLSGFLGMPGKEEGALVTFQVPGPPALLGGFLVDGVVGFRKLPPGPWEPIQGGPSFLKGQAGKKEGLRLLDLPKWVKSQLTGREREGS